MRRRLVTVTLLVVGACALGGLVAQSLTPAGATAASRKATHAKSKTAKKSTTHSGAHQSATATARTPHADGTVTAVNGNTITVKPDTDAAGSNEYTKVTTVIIGGSTQISTGRGTAATVAAITVGSRFVAEGTLSSDGTTLTATRFQVAPADHAGHAGGRQGAGGPHADGTVTGVSGNTISVTPDTDRAGSNEYTKVTTINVTGSTTYDAGRGATASLASVTKGAYIIATGTVSSDGTTLAATHISVHAAGKQGSHHRG
jgi:hypothetical protein